MRIGLDPRIGPAQLSAEQLAQLAFRVENYLHTLSHRRVVKVAVPTLDDAVRLEHALKPESRKRVIIGPDTRFVVGCGPSDWSDLP